MGDEDPSEGDSARQARGTVARMRPPRPVRLALDAALAAAALAVSLGAMSHGGWDREELAGDARELDGSVSVSRS